MILRSSVCLASALAVSTVSAEALKKEYSEKPNILVVVCEDISPYLGCYGDSVAKTPHLDQFSTQGILHKNMFTCVGVSSPSRYSLITGRYASEDGANFMRVNYFDKAVSVVPPKEVKCYTEFLRQAGYYCTNNAKTDYQFDTPISAWDEQGNKAHWRNAPKDQPFFSIFNLNITHESQVWKNTSSPLLVSTESILVPPYYPDNAIIRHDMAVMYSNVSKMDQAFNKIITELEKSDRAKNTIVIFYSDNGGPLPRAKREILDSGTHVPFLIRFPDGQGAGSENSDLNMFVDIPSTILSLAGLKSPKYMHGKPMYGRYKEKSKRKYVFGATDRFDEQVEKRASIRSDKYLYVRNYKTQDSNYRPNAFRLQMRMMQEMVRLYELGKLNQAQSIWFTKPAAIEELYDCENDPHQIKNLVGSPTYRKQLNKMRKAYQKEWIDPYNSFWVKAEESDFLAKWWPLGKKPEAELPSYIVEDGYLYFKNIEKGLSISYQLNGLGTLERNNHWFLYNNGIKLTDGVEISLIASRIGYLNSKILRLKF